MKSFIYQILPTGRRHLVATFHNNHLLATTATGHFNDYSEPAGSAPFVCERDDQPKPPDPAHEAQLATLQVETNKARPTKRKIVYHTSHEPAQADGKLRMIAYTDTHGTIRGVVEDSAFGKNLFFSRVRSVWPNAILQ